jgi:murein L,D-transpeptidase YcbB/YkuD
MTRLEQAGADSGVDRALLARNLSRLAVHAAPAGRHVLVDVAGQRLYMFDGNRVMGSMPVIVGKPDQQTPLLSGTITRLIAQPYWNVPLDLAQRRIAPQVVRHGVGWLKGRGMEVLDPTLDAPRRIAASSIDWNVVAAERAEARVRQKPGPANMMGKMKFEMPNELGIYLHDTPDRHLFAAEERTLSSGCIRVADWQALATWLWGGDVPADGTVPEQILVLPRPVPIRIVYLTLSPLGPGGWATGLVRQPDPYGLDRPLIRARADPASVAVHG